MALRLSGMKKQIKLDLMNYSYTEDTCKVTRRDWQRKLMTSQLSIDLYTLPVALCFASVFRLAKWRQLIVTSGFSFTTQYANTR